MKTQDLKIVGEVNISKIGLSDYEMKKFEDGKCFVPADQISKNQYPYVYKLRDDGGFSVRGIYGWGGSINTESFFKETEFLKIVL